LKKEKAGETSESTDEDGLRSTSVWAWNAFVALNSQRHVTERRYPQPIAINEVYAYARCFGLDPSEQRTLLGWMLELDRIYMEHRFAQIENEQRQAARKSAARNRGMR